MNHLELIKNVPELTQALPWIQKGQQKKSWTGEFVSLQWSDIAQNPKSPFGLYASENWQKFVLTTFLADLVCYEKAVDQVSFDRLLFVMHAFPQGFRVWWMQAEDRSWWPVGYTGWYPMLETAFEIFDKSPEKLKDRMVVPHVQSPYLYLFNYSVEADLRKSALSKALIKTYVDDIQQQNGKGLACVTVSDDGARVAKQFGMHCSGYLQLDGTQEAVYTHRINPQP